MVLFFKDLSDAIEAVECASLIGKDFVVIDGPEDNFALVDRYTAAELQDCELADVIDLQKKVQR